jgi:hypothetical protein
VPNICGLKKALCIQIEPNHITQMRIGIRGPDSLRSHQEIALEGHGGIA